MNSISAGGEIPSAGGEIQTVAECQVQSASHLRVAVWLGLFAGAVIGVLIMTSRPAGASDLPAHRAFSNETIVTTSPRVSSEPTTPSSLPCSSSTQLTRALPCSAGLQTVPSLTIVPIVPLSIPLPDSPPTVLSRLVVPLPALPVRVISAPLPMLRVPLHTPKSFARLETLGAGLPHATTTGAGAARGVEGDAMQIYPAVLGLTGPYVHPSRGSPPPSQPWGTGGGSGSGRNATSDGSGLSSPVGWAVTSVSEQPTLLVGGRPERALTRTPNAPADSIIGFPD